jgi:hypothetical protein
MVSIVAFAYLPKAFSSTTLHTARVTPTTTTLPVTQLNFEVNKTGDNVINRTRIVLPSNVNYTGVIAPVNATSGWYYTYNLADNSLDFTGNVSCAIGEASCPSDDYLHHLWFNITMQWLSVPPGQAVFSVNCSLTTISPSPGLTTQSSSNPQLVNVTFTPQFSATITPSPVVKSSTAYLFYITTTNTGAGIGISEINITYPSGWTFNALLTYSPATWRTSQDVTKHILALTGPNLAIGASAWVQVNMTSGSTTQDPSHWNSTAWNGGETWLGTCDLPVAVDKDLPIVHIDTSSSFYGVGSGNHIWVNATVTEDLNITKYGLTVASNDTRFGLASSAMTTSLIYTYYFANTSAIPDGPLYVNVTATDAAGHLGHGDSSYTVDNNGPSLLSLRVRDPADLPSIAGVYWMSTTSATIDVNATFYSPLGCDLSGSLYFNGTLFESFHNYTWTTTGYDVRGVDLVILNITLTDTCSPVNRFTQTWNIVRDKVSPSATTFTASAICGGAIIRSLNATDIVGIYSYRVYVNGTRCTSDVTIDQLNTTTALVSSANWTAFNNVLVLNLTTSGGKVANITITALDYAGNEGPGGTPQYISIPLDRWSPIELQPGWNLIGLPLIPANNASAAVLSLILKQGASGVIVYGYDSTTNSFTLNPATVVDGKGYWIYMNAYDVMIVSGRVSPTPPALPPNYDLVTGWNLAGYKSITTHSPLSYLSSLPTTPTTYFAYIYVWDAIGQTWQMKTGSSDTLSPGQGFWIWMYSNQTLIPPIP